MVNDDPSTLISTSGRNRNRTEQVWGGNFHAISVKKFVWFFLSGLKILSPEQTEIPPARDTKSSSWRNKKKNLWLIEPDIATVSGCDQLVVGPTHARGGTLDLLITDVPDLVPVAVVAPIGNSDHSFLSAVISMAQAVPNLCASRKVFLKHQVNWKTVCGAIRDLPWRNIWLSDNPVEVWNEHLSLLVGRYVPTKVIHVHNKDKPWFDDQCRHVFGLKHQAHLW